MGGAGEKALECAAEVCDGWAPWLMEWLRAKEAISRLKQRTEANGRDPGALELSLFETSVPDPTTMQDMEAAGVGRIIVTLFAGTREEALPALDRIAETNR